MDSDGILDIVVGAPFDDTGGSDKGAVHIIFLNSDDTPKSTVEINSSTPNGPVLIDSGRFGYSVDNLGDFNDDGINDIAVGAGGDDEGGNARGTLHIVFLDGLFCGQPESYYNVINGTELQDYLVGTNSPDLIFGNGGNDMIYTRGENNCVYAGDGNDFVLANKNGNTVYGGAGDDSIQLKGTGIAYGEDGNDSTYIIKPSVGHLIDGGDGSDLCVTNVKQPINTANCEITVP